MRGGSLDLSDSFHSPSSSAPSSLSNFPGRHYYLAVDRLQFKMETLVDLLEVAGKQPSLPIVICCSSRDELDAVCSTVANLSYISFSPLYSDQAEIERASILEKFRLATLQWNQKYSVLSLDCMEPEHATRKSCMVVTTDACLPSSALGEASLTAHLLINYELPTKKETYCRRTSSCLAADGIVINMVVGGEVATLRALEETSGLIITEMPISISEIL
ncbi:initiation factor 4A-like protein isoform X1 [Carex rostrata]